MLAFILSSTILRLGSSLHHSSSSSSSSVLVPRLLADPLEPDARVGPDLDGGGLRGRDGLLDGLHQVLRVAYQHLSGLLVFLGA